MNGRPLAAIAGRMAGAIALAAIAACGGGPGTSRAGGAPTASDATAFLAQVDARMLELGTTLGRAGWVQQNFITVDTEALNARATQAFSEAVATFARDATRFDGLTLAEDERRQLNLLRLSLTLAVPSDPKLSEELTTIAARMDGTYGRGKYCPDPARPDDCLDIEAITEILASSRDPKRLQQVWEGWHSIAKPMRPDYERFAELSNLGAAELGFADTGAMWRSKYDMPPEEFAAEMDRLWEQVRPLYLSLHAYVRMKLREKYGEIVPANGPIPAHLTGNLWAQDWSNIYPIVTAGSADAGFDLTRILTARRTSALDMVKFGEGFFTSLGLAPLPQTFFERSLFVKPRDRDVVCHASAWSIDLADDVRIKMCIDPTAEDFTTIHHELGHTFYQLAYKHQPVLFRDSANDGFHEALGDTIGLSVTPEYLVKLGFIPSAPDASRDIGLLLNQALSKIAFLPFGLLVDQWRWQVFSGAITPANYNEAWWAMRLQYQGIAPPGPRGEEYFDPGAKYHVPGNTPYARYFLAAILQFQFHRALAEASGCTGPLHRCSIYGSTAAGDRLARMMAMGLSRPWPEALEALTGSKQMDATAILEYFAPLQQWLDAQTAGQTVGW